MLFRVESCKKLNRDGEKLVESWLAGWLVGELFYFLGFRNCSCSCAVRGPSVLYASGFRYAGSYDTSCIKTIPNDGCSHGKIWFICKLPPASPFLLPPRAYTLAGIFHFVAADIEHRIFPIIFVSLPCLSPFLSLFFFSLFFRSNSKLVSEKATDHLFD